MQGDMNNHVTMETCFVHHVEFGVKNGLGFARKLYRQYGFKPIATRTSSKAKQWVLSSGLSSFLITEPLTLPASLDDVNNEDLSQNDPYFIRFTESSKLDEIKDTVFNIAFAVNDVLKLVQKLMQSGVQIIKPVSCLSDEHGTVWTATVKSCVGNVVHTLVQRDNYTGSFLPGFHSINNADEFFACSEESREKRDPKLTSIDHVTFAAYCGSADEILHWYEKTFGMKRFYINRQEDEVEGFVIGTDNIGLRLKAFEYWKCAEVGLISGKANGVKFIIAEALTDQGPNQVDTFLCNHGGAGVQHIALSSTDIVSSVSALAKEGVQFVEPPYTYYTEIGKWKEIMEIGQNVSVLKEHGILIDSEADAGNSSTDTTSKHRYLLQKFTKPLFDHDTFFLEIIQRQGATGFGAGNIMALWRAVQAYMNEKSNVINGT